MMEALGYMTEETLIYLEEVHRDKGPMLISELDEPFKTDLEQAYKRAGLQKKYNRSKLKELTKNMKIDRKTCRPR